MEHAEGGGGRGNGFNAEFAEIAEFHLEEFLRVLRALCV